MLGMDVSWRLYGSFLCYRQTLNPLSLSSRCIVTTIELAFEILLLARKGGLTIFVNRRICYPKSVPGCVRTVKLSGAVVRPPPQALAELSMAL